MVKRFSIIINGGVWHFVAHPATRRGGQAWATHEVGTGALVNIAAPGRDPVTDLQRRDMTALLSQLLALGGLPELPPLP